MARKGRVFWLPTATSLTLAINSSSRIDLLRDRDPAQVEFTVLRIRGVVRVRPTAGSSLDSQAFGAVVATQRTTSTADLPDPISELNSSLGDWMWFQYSLTNASGGATDPSGDFVAEIDNKSKRLIRRGETLWLVVSSGGAHAVVTYAAMRVLILVK